MFAACGPSGKESAPAVAPAQGAKGPVGSPSASGQGPAGGPSATTAAATSVAVQGAPASNPPISETARAVIAAGDRSEEDRKLDGGRHPAELLSFFRIGPGMKVAELAAGGGYTAELLARAVGPSGVVYGQNSRWILERFAERPWSERLAKPAMKNVVRVDREFDDPFPPEVRELDAVFCILFYHDLFWQGVPRAPLNAAVFRALRHGGIYAVVDHRAKPGAGANEVKTLHRIEESVVRAEIEKAGFRLRAEGAFLQNPNDTRDWNDSPSAAGDRRGTSDRFVLAFEKP
jgi:predicted methyltransferase